LYFMDNNHYTLFDHTGIAMNIDLQYSGLYNPIGA